MAELGMSRRAVALIATMCVAASLACMRHFVLEAKVGGQAESRPPVEAMVHPSGGAAREHWFGPAYPGPYMIVELSASEDLQLLSDKLDVNAVRYFVYACSKQKKRISILNGPVFFPQAVESRASNSAHDEKAHSFSIFLPTDVEKALEHSMGHPGQPDIASELLRAKADGLCVVVSAGGWFHAGFSSKAVRIPVSFDGVSLSPVSQEPGVAE